MPSKPSLDYYIGRSADRVEYPKDSKGEWDWVITLSGNVHVHNLDKRRTALPNVAGKVFLIVVFSKSDTTMKFGHYDMSNEMASIVDEEVVLTPTAYAIADESYPGGPHYPQKTDEEEQAEMEPPDDPSDERVVDAAENASLEASEAS